jgi:hypothetical protein
LAKHINAMGPFGSFWVLFLLVSWVLLGPFGSFFLVQKVYGGNSKNYIEKTKVATSRAAEATISAVQPADRKKPGMCAIEVITCAFNCIRLQLFSLS